MFLLNNIMASFDNIIDNVLDDVVKKTIKLCYEYIEDIFNDYMYKEIGWRIGHIDDTVRYMENGEPKVRMQEDTDTSFYSFITETIAEQFCCVPIFDRKNKLVNLYDIDSFGDEVKLVLSKDNYLKSLEKTSNSSDIIT